MTLSGPGEIKQMDRSDSHYFMHCGRIPATVRSWGFKVMGLFQAGRRLEHEPLISPHEATGTTTNNGGAFPLLLYDMACDCHNEELVLL